MNAPPPVRVSLRDERGGNIVQVVDNPGASARDVEQHDVGGLRNAPENGGQESGRRVSRARRMRNGPLPKDSSENVGRGAPEERAARVGEEYVEELARDGRGYDGADEGEDGIEEPVTALVGRRSGHGVGEEAVGGRRGGADGRPRPVGAGWRARRSPAAAGPAKLGRLPCGGGRGIAGALVRDEHLRLGHVTFFGADGRRCGAWPECGAVSGRGGVGGCGPARRLLDARLGQRRNRHGVHGTRRRRLRCVVAVAPREMSRSKVVSVHGLRVHGLRLPEMGGGRLARGLGGASRGGRGRAGRGRRRRRRRVTGLVAVAAEASA
ncbi:hypothetical protein G6O67_006689 [Ophiocordyceps sinensis]|uniref:Uncharacterized protein n=1 Tax=Ophiocordyceps sinensis TaxID=72228 RepID=A0A8H4LW69_9HYPO|nr:hypothetical protein G6O67_006689 [Ophiocordyceps sinensis]